MNCILRNWRWFCSAKKRKRREKKKRGLEEIYSEGVGDRYHHRQLVLSYHSVCENHLSPVEIERGKKKRDQHHHLRLRESSEYLNRPILDVVRRCIEFMITWRLATSTMFGCRKWPIFVCIFGYVPCAGLPR